jgi:two-component system sensor histidine kinase YesM
MIKRAKKWIIQQINNLRITQKLLISYLILISIPLGILTLVIYDFSTETLYKYVSYSAEQSFNQTFSYLSYLTDNIINAPNIIVSDNTLNDILMKNPAAYNQYEQVLDMHDILQYLSSFKNSRDIYRVRLYVHGGLIYTSENSYIFNIDEIQSSVWYQKLSQTTDKVLFCPVEYIGEKDANGLGVLSVARFLRNRNNYTDNIAVLRVDMDMSNIIKILNNANPTDASVSCLINSEGIVVASSGPSELVGRAASSLIKREHSENGRFEELTVEGEKIMLMSRLIPGTDWSMFTIIPYDNFNRERMRLQTTLLLTIFIIGTLAFLLAFAFSRSITQRIYMLIHRMRAIRQGKVDSAIENTAKDEIGELYDNYNFMMQRISVLIDEQYQLGQQVKSAELKALQAQINPHFLYNTLDMINWMSRMNRNSEISSVVEALANFYKLTLNRGKDIVTVRDEIKHASYYIKIQTLRFNNQITTDFDIDPAVLETPIPKITIQSLVENAIHHGILETEEKRGHIHISGRLEGKTVVLSVQDDGVGIPPDKMPGFENAEPKQEASGSHYGIRNVNMRIKLMFGEAYGLTFHSELGKGTIVEVRLPYQEG